MIDVDDVPGTDDDARDSDSDRDSDRDRPLA